MLKTFAWITLAFIVFATISPIGWRPHDYLPVNVDRALAFTVMSALFVLAYPRYWVLSAVVLLLAAFPIELLQNLSSSRHAHFDDAGIKAAGAAVGIVAGWLINEIRARRTSSV